ncbi:MAG: hypothetical protein IPF67_16410 [Saprospiraceae bacterium]|nr:hypothetical protein [Candidatus Brachybacter algidus]
MRLHPDGAHGCDCVDCGNDSLLTFVPAAIASFLSGKVKETESPVMAWAKKAYADIDGNHETPRELTVTIGLPLLSYCQVY